MNLLDHFITLSIITAILTLFGVGCYYYGRWSILRKFGKKRGGYKHDLDQR